MVEYVKTGFAENKSTGAVFLDIQKAFDRVWHYGLLYKLIRTNTPYLIKIIKSFLENRNFSVLVNHSYSPLKNISAGVPQGALLSPTLFNIYVNDIPRTSFSTICLYADDTAILVQNANLQMLAHQLHKHLARLEHWLSTWKIALNVEKTEAVFFSRNIKKKPPNIYIQNKHIPWSQSTKYLGVTLDKRLTFRHLIKLRKNFRISVAKIYPLISRNSFLSLRNKLLIYMQILRPTLIYACPIWGHAAHSNINQIEIAQNLILRTITKADWYIRNADIRSALNIKTLKEVIKKIATKFFNNIDAHDNRAILRIEKYPINPLFNRPRNILANS
ncbi:RNA-directed DNA polymerase from mobile element jockey [Trichonephila clavipes]|nr:RNA-directed DNA polymerase from mobile element jockey [Trichonephila clavipes]